jgi:RimJ/RimL family protein N-acetyltransferase
MKPSVALRSERLELRPLDRTDAAFVQSLYADAQVTRTLLRIQGPISLEEAREYCRASTIDDSRFAGLLQTEGSIIAVGSVRTYPRLPGVASIGYAVLPAFWGQGFGTELAALLVEFATGTIGALEVRATTLDENPASAHVLEKLGFGVLEAGASEVDWRGEDRRVTRWSVRKHSRQQSRPGH